MARLSCFVEFNHVQEEDCIKIDIDIDGKESRVLRMNRNFFHVLYRRIVCIKLF